MATDDIIKVITHVRNAIAYLFLIWSIAIGGALDKAALLLVMKVASFFS
ncbi:hypothetical protein SD340_004300 [Vibrio fluvialis]|nr:hypothetical protein [Vibrio fluvialis]EKO3528650.1 hypothetical protein [Vibrio fluvialis]ELC0660915.1 hypothetical protein [Vibrio fluvialis]ELU8402386.1 hypothetical protein [Vibrio fluvialis]